MENILGVQFFDFYALQRIVLSGSVDSRKISDVLSAYETNLN